MKGIFMSFVRKETLHIVRDPRTMMIVLLMPVIQMVLFGFAISNEVNNIDVAVVAPHPTEAVRQAVERMSSNPYFTFKGYVPGTRVDATLRSGEADAVVVFADDYDRRIGAFSRGEGGEAALQIVFDASDTNTASAGAGYLRGVLLGGMSAVSAPETHLLYNPQMKSSYSFVPGIMGMIFMLICAMMTSVSIVREKETGTMEVLLVSPVRPLRIVFAKMIPYFTLSCVNLLTILLLARFVLEVFQWLTDAQVDSMMRGGMPETAAAAGDAFCGMFREVLLLANMLHIDIANSIARKIAIVDKRVYPDDDPVR